MPDLPTLVQSHRRMTYRKHGPPLASADDVLDFVNTVGFSLLFPVANMQLPDIWTICVSEHDAWAWKDDLPADRQLYYGKILRRKAVLVALDIMPALYAISPTADTGGDRFELYSMGILSSEANRIAGIVMAKGPLSTRQLRQAAGMAGKASKSRFERALEECQRLFLVAKSHATPPGIGSYSYVWDGFSKLWPEIVETGLRRKYEESLADIIMRYLTTSLAATTQDIARLFAVESSHVQHMADWLVSQGKLTQLEYKKKPYYVMPEIAEILNNTG